jgi:hypothetical protein
MDDPGVSAESVPEVSKGLFHPDGDIIMPFASSVE